MYDYTENYYEIEDNVSRPMKDLDYIFGLHPISNDIRKKNDVQSIKQSVKTLVLLNHYEKPFHPDIGCDVYKSMFEPFEDSFTTSLMEGYIKNVINNYEPRVVLDKIDIDVQEENNFLGITIWFTPVGEVDSVSVEIFLNIIR